jgi:hypothetical protein
MCLAVIAFFYFEVRRTAITGHDRATERGIQIKRHAYGDGLQATLGAWFGLSLGHLVVHKDDVDRIAPLHTSHSRAPVSRSSRSTRPVNRRIAAPSFQRGDAGL